MDKYDREIIKNIGAFFVYNEISKAGKRMSKMRKENMNKVSEQPEPQSPASYEYVFLEVAVKKVYAVVAGLVGIIISNGVYADPELLAGARDVMDTMQQALNPNQQDLPATQKENINGN